MTSERPFPVPVSPVDEGRADLPRDGLGRGSAKVRPPEPTSVPLHPHPHMQDATGPSHTFKVDFSGYPDTPVGGHGGFDRATKPADQTRRFGRSYQVDSVMAGRSPKRVLWEVIRSLRIPDDLPILRESLPSPQKSITQIRHSHHQAARLIAEGVPLQEASLITGYSPNYLSQLQGDPMFVELVSYYATNEDKKHIDVMDRLRSLGMSTLDELQTRLEESPESYSIRELMEQVDLTLIKPLTTAARNPATTLSGHVAVNVKFVQSDQPPSLSPGHLSSKSSPVIDVTPQPLPNNTSEAQGAQTSSGKLSEVGQSRSSPWLHPPPKDQ